MATNILPATASGIDKAHRQVIFASSLGTVFEWYDFYLYGSLAAIISKQFFSGVNETTGFIFALLAFAAGFAVRPFGALVFGRLGDLVGRKHTFLITIVIMGLSTALVGVLPSYATAGVIAPVALVVLRLLQGLALGGEYGGAATYVGEHAPPGKRGRYTSWIQTTATLGLFLSLVVILLCRSWLGAEFDDLGLADPLPGVRRAARHFGVHPHATGGIPGVSGNEGRGHEFQGAAHGVLRALGKPAARDPGVARRDRRAGRRLVLRSVLRPLLPDAGTEGRSADGESADRRRRFWSGRPSSSCSAFFRTRSAARRSSWPDACSPP